MWTGPKHGRGAVPVDVYEQAARFAPTYTHVVIDDDDARDFLARRFPPNVSTAYEQIPENSCAATQLDGSSARQRRAPT